MPVTRIESYTSGLSVHIDGENTAPMRNKANQLVAKNLGATAKPRAVLGDICNNLPTNSKPDEKDVLMKKPSVKPVKKSATECEVQQLQTTGEALHVVEVERRPSFSSQNLNIEDIDTEANPQLVAVYVKDIYQYLHELEDKTTIKPNYMDGYKIRPSMRTILIDWLVEVHGRFKLLQETLYLTVAIMDRFLQSLLLLGKSCSSSA